MDTMMSSLGGYCSTGYNRAIQGLRAMVDLAAHEAVGGGRDLSSLSQEAQLLLETRGLLKEAKAAREAGDINKVRNCMMRLKSVRAMRGLKAFNPFSMLATDAMVDSLQAHQRGQAMAQLNSVRQAAGRAPIHTSERNQNLLIEAFSKNPELEMADLDGQLKSANADRARRGSRPIDTDTMIYLWANQKDPGRKQPLDPEAVHSALTIDVSGLAGEFVRGLDPSTVDGHINEERLNMFNRMRQAADLPQVDALAMKVVQGNEGLAGFDFAQGFKMSNATRARNGRAPLSYEQYLYVLHTRAGGPSLVSPPEVPESFTRIPRVPAA